MQRLPVPSQVLISFLKATTDSVFFASLFRAFHSITPLNLTDQTALFSSCLCSHIICKWFKSFVSLSFEVHQRSASARLRRICRHKCFRHVTLALCRSGADPDRCNRCKCIGQFHMIDYLEVCAAEFLLDSKHLRSFEMPPSSRCNCS